MLIRELLSQPATGQKQSVRGWVRTKRELKNLVFVEINDGSCLASVQCVFRTDAQDIFDLLSTIGTGCSVEISGKYMPSPAAGQQSELEGESLHIIGGATAYPLQKKKHSMEFLRDNAHLRARTNTFGAVARVRSRLAFAVHEFFQERGFIYMHSPIITAGDAEGAGAMFRVVAPTEDPSKPETYFFGKKAFLTVSGQLEAETYATALSRVYTFGPTFRAENSNTVRHLSEFWMIEPEAAFMDLEGNMGLAEDFLRFLLKTALEKCSEDLAFFDARIEKGLIASLDQAAAKSFARLSYTEAVQELEKHADEFVFKPFWGCDLQSEHEKFLTEKVACGPLIVTDYPKEIKAFYMKLNEDGRTVRAMDVLVPRLGEIIGGSQREDSLGALEQAIADRGMKIDDYQWYLDLRRFGTVPHSGFGMGFERLVLYVTGMANIRDVIPYPRAPGLAEF